MPWITPDAHAQALEAARDIALRRLDHSAAPRSVLEALLERKKVDPRIATEALDRLEAAGLIDDAAYAAMLARTRFAEKGSSRRAIADELRRKAVGEGAISAALSQISGDDEADAALVLARKRLLATAGLEPAVQERRVLAALGRKGYSLEAARSALDQARRQAGDLG